VTSGSRGPPAQTRAWPAQPRSGRADGRRAAQIPRYVRTDAAAVRVRRAAPRGAQQAAAVTLEVGSVHGGRCPLPLFAAVAVTLPVRSGCRAAGWRTRAACSPQRHDAGPAITLNRLHLF
jgi:hypothetical protein